MLVHPITRLGCGIWLKFSWKYDRYEGAKDCKMQLRKSLGNFPKRGFSLKVRKVQRQEKLKGLQKGS